jgi:hypothetical protein
MCHIALSLRLFIPNGLQLYHHFFFRGLCFWCLWSVSPPFTVARFSRWLLSKLLPCSLLKAVVRAYHHEPQTMLPLDPVYNIIYPADYLVRVLQWGLEFGRFPLRAGWATERHSVTLVVVRANNLRSPYTSTWRSWRFYLTSQKLFKLKNFSYQYLPRSGGAAARYSKKHQRVTLDWPDLIIMNVLSGL